MSPTRRSTYARARTKSHAAPSNSESQLLPQPSASSLSSSIMPTKQDPMPPSSRYLHNLRVIQRHDPTITSLFDQFPHVCVYHHKGDEWQKKGCEGAMFLFEREEEPKYGFYILNRNNTGDYIQRLTPDDDVELASAYLIYRAYGKVTSDTIGLWTMATQDREAMTQVVMRLHSYIKRGERYPDMYRRRPETWSTTPAPVHARAQIQFISQPQTQTLSQSLSHSHSRPQLQTLSQSFPHLTHSTSQPTASSTQTDLSSSASAFSTLLAKLDSSNTSSPSLSTSIPSLTPSIAPLVKFNLKAPDRTISATVPPATTTGIPLLDSIFASASGADVARSGPESNQPSNPLSAFLQSNALQPPTNGIGHSPSSSSGVTPRPSLAELPRSSSPKKLMSSTTNGTRHTTSLNTAAMRGALPTESSSRPAYRNGRESAPPGKINTNTNHVPQTSSLSLGVPSTNGVHHPPVPRRRHSSQYPHLSIPEAKEEEEANDDEDEGLANTSANIIDSPPSSALPSAPRSLSAAAAKRKGKKKERTRVGGTGRTIASSYPSQSVPNGGPTFSSVTVKDNVVEWPLIDDRSLSIDGSEEGEISGLGDGLMDAIAAFSESDACTKVNGSKSSGPKEPSLVNGLNTSRSVHTAVADATSAAASSANANGRGGRRKRKLRERERGDDRFVSLNDNNGTTGNHNGSGPGLLHTINTSIAVPEITRAPSSSSASSYPAIPVPTAEVRNALMQTYGNRRRIGDAVLGEKEFKAEVVDLITNDPTFMRELYQMYLRKVKV